MLLTHLIPDPQLQRLADLLVRDDPQAYRDAYRREVVAPSSPEKSVELPTPK